MRGGSKLLFIGHAPPPARQWQSTKLSGGNATINHLSRFWRSEGFARVLHSKGLGPEPIETDVALDIVNIIPVISVGTEPIGKKGGTCLNDYVGSGGRRTKNSDMIRHQVEKGKHDLIIVGWGHMTGSRAKLANDMLSYLRKEALDRTIVYAR